jgi:hypothetical protein
VDIKRALEVSALPLLLLGTIGSAAAQNAAPGKPAAKTAGKKPAKETVVTATPGAAMPAPRIAREKKQVAVSNDDSAVVAKPRPMKFGPPIELHMSKASGSRADLRSLPQSPPDPRQRPERATPAVKPVTVEGGMIPPEPSARP